MPSNNVCRQGWMEHQGLELTLPYKFPTLLVQHEEHATTPTTLQTDEISNHHASGRWKFTLSAPPDYDNHRNRFSKVHASEIVAFTKPSADATNTQWMANGFLSQGREGLTDLCQSQKQMLLLLLLLILLLLLLCAQIDSS